MKDPHLLSLVFNPFLLKPPHVFTFPCSSLYCHFFSISLLKFSFGSCKPYIVKFFIIRCVFVTLSSFCPFMLILRKLSIRFAGTVLKSTAILSKGNMTHFWSPVFISATVINSHGCLNKFEKLVLEQLIGFLDHKL